MVVQKIIRSCLDLNTAAKKETISVLKIMFKTMFTKMTQQHSEPG